MPPRTVIGDLSTTSPRSMKRVCGWVCATSAHAFGLRDSTGQVDVVMDGREAGPQEVAVGDAVEVEGELTDEGAFHAKAMRRWPRRAAGSAPRNTAYLRFRDPAVVNMFRRAGDAVQVAHAFLRRRHFVELATPMVWNGTQEYGEPELVAVDPRHRDQGGYLLQSPTVPQMLCVVGGVDRSYQFARCFRSEPGAEPTKSYEFTQLNLTLAFTSPAEQQELLEGLFTALSRELTGEAWPAPFPSISHREAEFRYGCDFPDWRFPDVAKPIVDGALLGQPRRRARLVLLPGFETGFAEAIATVLAPRVGPAFGVWGWSGQVTESGGDWTPPGEMHLIAERWGMTAPLTGIALPAEVSEMFVRQLVATVHPKLSGRRPPRFAPVWINRPPFLHDEAAPEGGYHHSRALFGVRLPGDAAIESYDLVVNGMELLSGGQKECDRERLLDGFAVAGVRRPEQRYGYFLDALDQGAPPLHNSSIGWERTLALLLGVTMRDVMVMPKTGDGSCPVSGLPVPV